MRMFVLISHFQKPLEEVSRSFELHSAWVQRQYQAGRFLVSGRREVLSTDPYQQRGLAEYEIFAFEATDFPKRSSAFDSFALNSLRELPPVQETGV